MVQTPVGQCGSEHRTGTGWRRIAPRRSDDDVRTADGVGVGRVRVCSTALADAVPPTDRSIRDQALRHLRDYDLPSQLNRFALAACSGTSDGHCATMVL